MRIRALLLVLLAGLCLLATTAAGAGARSSEKKGLWATYEPNPELTFPIYRDLGVRTLLLSVGWDQVAQSRPVGARDPGDPAYHWPASIDAAIRLAPQFGMRTMVRVMYAPPWANGGHAPNVPPVRTADYTDFLRAAARRWPQVRLWQIWGEPNLRRWWASTRFTGLRPPRSKAELQGPRQYARLLDASYGALKSESSKNLVIGGNTFTAGDVRPLFWIPAMKLPDGRPPRMDLYGHNPFTGRKIDMDAGSLGPGYADFNDLDTLGTMIDRFLRRDRGKPGPRLFLSEFTAPTNANDQFTFHFSEAGAARQITDALRVVRASKRIDTLGYYTLYDAPAQADGREDRRGLIDRTGRRRPAYDAFRDG
ncbi:MAG: hypothetical protein ABW167_18870 [Baekduia sp.]